MDTLTDFRCGWGSDLANTRDLLKGREMRKDFGGCIRLTQQLGSLGAIITQMAFPRVYLKY